MPKIRILGLALLIGALLPAATSRAEDSVLSTTEGTEIKLTAAEKEERESRKACKLKVCRAFHSDPADSGEIKCDLIKSWRKSQLDKMISKLKISWPYGPVRCSTKFAVDRDALGSSLNKPEYSLDMQTHSVNCTIDREKKDPAKITFDFTLSVKFKDGEAQSVDLNWGKIGAPTLVKAFLWTATAAENATHILSKSLTKDINKFVGKKCEKLKNEWQK